MANATSFDLPNYVGPLFGLTDKQTPFLAMIGGLTGGRETKAKAFTWQDYSLDAPSQPAILESATATASHKSRTERSNVVQIFQYAVDISYTKLAATEHLASDASPILGSQPVQDELSFQIMLKIEQAALDVNFTFHQGTYQSPANNVTARKTRGMLAAIQAANEEAAAAAALADTHVDGVMLKMYNSEARFRNVVGFLGAAQKQKFSGIYGYAPEDRNLGGVNIQVVETDFARLGLVLDRGIPTDDIGLYDLSVIAPRLLRIPKKGHFFVEPLAKTKAAEEAQLYGEIGLEYGPAEWHGKITNLAV